MMAILLKELLQIHCLRLCLHLHLLRLLRLLLLCLLCLLPLRHRLLLH